MCLCKEWKVRQHLHEGDDVVLTACFVCTFMQVCHDSVDDAGLYAACHQRVPDTVIIGAKNGYQSYHVQHIRVDRTDGCTHTHTLLYFERMSACIKKNNNQPDIYERTIINKPSAEHCLHRVVAAKRSPFAMQCTVDTGLDNYLMIRNRMQETKQPLLH